MSQSELSDRELASTAMGLSRDKRRGDYISRPFQAEWMLTWASDLALSLLWSLPRDEVLELNARLSLMLQKDIIAHLPPELSILILAKLDLDGILSCTRVSRTWAKLCDDQALWSMKCAAHTPPIRPAPTTWADLATHRHLLHLSTQASVPTSEDEGGGDSSMDDITFDSDDTFGHTDPIAAQGGLGGGGDISPVANPAALRRSVWERSGSGLPTYSSSSSTQPQGAPEFDTSAFQEAPVPSSLPVPTPTPTANLKHLHIVHRILSRRMRSPQTPLHCRKIGDRRSKRMRSRTVDARSSIEAGGLPGHSETIYSLKMIRHRMSITMTQARPDCRHRPPDGPFQTMMTLTGISPGPADAPVIVSGRDWLLSGSRDRTLRLWQMACPEPKVVKVFHGGHTGSVLSHFVVKLPDKDGKAERVMAVSGGSDGKICLWDVEHGDGSPEKVVKAHHDSVLCVAGDDERIVSCSKDKTIRVFDIRTLRQTMSCGDVEDHDVLTPRPAANAVSISKDYIISASGDRTLRVWCIRTGNLLTSLEVHSRGIASVAFEPASPYTDWTPTVPGSVLRGTIITGCSDASIKKVDLVKLPRENELVPPMRDLTFREMLEDVTIASVPESEGDLEEQVGEERANLVLDKARTCWASCVCPPGLVKPDNTRCGRCFNRGHTEIVRSLHLGEDVILSGSYDSTVKIWDRQTGRMLADLSGGHTGRLFAVTGDRMRVVSSGLDCRINIWDFSDGLDTSFVVP